MIIAHRDINELEHKYVLLAHHLSGKSYTRTGYGSRIPTASMVRLPGSPRWRRVYVCIWSNSCTAYVSEKHGDWIVITGSPKETK